MEKLKYEELEIYQLSEKLSDRIWEIVMNWNWFLKKTYSIQLVDSTSSIGANIAEGYGRKNKIDRGRFVKISRG